MNKAQRLVLKLFGETGEEVEREARSTFLTCPECGNEVTYWEVAGVRGTGIDDHAKVRLRCKRCGMRTWHEVDKRPPAPEPPAPEQGGAQAPK